MSDGLRLASTKPSTTATLLAIAVRRFPLTRSIDPSCWSGTTTTTTTTTNPTTTIRLQAFVTPVIGNHNRGTLPSDGHNPGKTLHSDYGRYEIHPRCRPDCGTDTTTTTTTTVHKDAGSEDEPALLNLVLGSTSSTALTVQICGQVAQRSCLHRDREAADSSIDSSVRSESAADDAPYVKTYSTLGYL
uniref:Uncharacterized protein n=1 Tax=Anopheles melas TaxID=34690 RepID=A0A182UKM3_9DIPT